MKRWPQRFTRIFLIAWAVVSSIWSVIGHIGNLQTVWELVKGWPIAFRYLAWLITTPWLPLVLLFSMLVTWEIVQRSRQTTAAESKERPAPSSGRDNRAISYCQETRMLDILGASLQTPIMISSVSDDEEANEYAKRLVQVFKKTGIRIGQAAFKDAWKLPDGINAWWVKNDTNNKEAAKIKEAIEATGLQCGDASRHAVPEDLVLTYGINIMVGARERS